MSASQVRAAVVVNNIRTEMRMFLPASVGPQGAQKAAENLTEILGMATQITFHAVLNYYCIVAKEIDEQGIIVRNSLAINADLHDELVRDANENVFNTHIPRPPNSWILYRQHHSREILRTNPGTPAGTISGIVSQMWHNEPPAAKAQWQSRADEAARRHREQYPGYRYRATRKQPTKAKSQKTSAHGDTEEHKDKEKPVSSSAIALRKYLANIDIEALALAL